LGEIINSRHCSYLHQPHVQAQPHNKVVHTFTVAYKPYNRETTARQAENRNKQVSPNFPYLEKASQTTLTPKPTNTTAPGEDLRTRISGTE